MLGYNILLNSPWKIALDQTITFPKALPGAVANSKIVYIHGRRHNIYIKKKNLLKPVSEVHTLNLRSSENGSLYVPKARTALFDGSFSCSAPRLWNALPQTVKTSGSLSTFKQSLKATF